MGDRYICHVCYLCQRPLDRNKLPAPPPPPLPQPVDADLVTLFEKQAAKSAHLDGFSTLVSKYQYDPDTTDDESASSPSPSPSARTGLLSPSPSPSIEGPPRRSLDPSPSNITAGRTTNLNRAPDLRPGSASTLHTHSKSTLQIIRQAIVVKRTTRSLSEPTTTFLALDRRGKAAVTNSVLSTPSRRSRM
ncbi:hypothetical protein B7494_g3231 [Chlorociboria aeruginascens]|nr:hypothetical protein B7494_g3231 [Chlorociboria aeruginascens]